MRKKIFAFTTLAILVCLAPPLPAQALTSDKIVQNIRAEIRPASEKNKVNIFLSWDQPKAIKSGTKKNFQYYIVNRDVRDFGNELNISPTAISSPFKTTSYTDKNLVRNKLYVYRIDTHYSDESLGSDLKRVYVYGDKTTIQDEKQFLTEAEEKSFSKQGVEGLKKIELAKKGIEVTSQADPSAVPNFLKDIFKIVYLVAPGLAIAAIIFAGFRYITSQGDPEAIKLAKEIIFGALSGLVLLILAKVFFNILIGELPYNLLP
jgi:hypothetical protein